MSRFNCVLSRTATASLVRVAILWTIWLAPLHWYELHAADNSVPSWRRGISTWNNQSYNAQPIVPDAISDQTRSPTRQPAPHKRPSWQRGISTWNGSSYSEQLTVADPTNESIQASAGQSAPYTVPVDPRLYSDPVRRGPQNRAARRIELTTPDSTPTLEIPANEKAVVPAEPDNQESATTGSQAAKEPASSAAPTVGDRIENGLTIDQPPPEKETLRWYQHPWRWWKSRWTNRGRAWSGWRLGKR